MNTIQERFLKLGLHIPDILLPSQETDLSKWAIIACDQFTSNGEYWDRVRETVGVAPSTYHATLPEIFLSEKSIDKRIADIHKSIHSYIVGGFLTEHRESCILVERKTPYTPVRTGLVLAVDLEKYDYRPGTQSLIRATEGTILDRIPPREKIRSGSPAEFSHIMLLMDDPGNRVFGPLADQAKSCTPLYDFELMLNGGHLRGYKIDSADILEPLAASFETLYAERKAKAADKKNPLLFAVGDGNHSLAAAKAVWEKVKRSTGEALHASRFALVELLNVYDPGLIFHPIHRVVFNALPEDLFDVFRKRYGAVIEFAQGNELLSDGIGTSGTVHTIGFCSRGLRGLIRLGDSSHHTAAGALQEILDTFIGEHPESTVDYIHGDEEVLHLSERENSVGFLLPAMSKDELFPTVSEEGILPRKAFSIGEAVEKRYYLEGRRIIT